MNSTMVGSGSAVSLALNSTVVKLLVEELKGKSKEDFIKWLQEGASLNSTGNETQAPSIVVAAAMAFFTYQGYEQLNKIASNLRLIQNLRGAPVLEAGFGQQIQFSLNSYQETGDLTGWYSRSLLDRSRESVIPGLFVNGLVDEMILGGVKRRETEHQGKCGFILRLDDVTRSPPGIGYFGVWKFPGFVVLAIVVLFLETLYVDDEFVHTVGKWFGMDYKGLVLAALKCAVLVPIARMLYAAIDLDTFIKTAKHSKKSKTLVARISDQIRPTIAEAYKVGAQYRAHGIDVEEAKYVWGLTYKEDKNINKKLRVIIVRLEILKQFAAEKKVAMKVSAAKKNMESRLPIFRDLLHYHNLHQNNTQEDRDPEECMAIWGSMDLAPGGVNN